ncbi:MAG: lamin tail domain-containing protein, partial [Flavihumibacter sp.]|nr:lamin tail domain-containing protein [Flavihumibacter sp.]
MTISFKLFIAAFFFLYTGSFGTQAQGRVVINEYLPWPVNGCGVTSEFVELYNFGPGPINIGCYVLTDGDFAVTIPANTILQPGQFYVIAGQNFIPTGCANINSDVVVNLNWN